MTQVDPVLVVDVLNGNGGISKTSLRVVSDMADDGKIALLSPISFCPVGLTVRGEALRRLYIRAKDIAALEGALSHAAA